MPEIQRVVAIVGPTGSGKARLAVAAARASGALILSTDSMKVYRGLDVGTAKPGPEQREGVEWHGLDLVWPWESFDASRFHELFEAVRAKAAREGRPLILSGGTMLYLKAATEGLSPTPPRDPEVRARIRAEAEAEGAPALHARLAAVDPEAAARLHPNDLRRIERALEVYEVSGRPLSAFHAEDGYGSVRDDLERIVFVVTREREDMDRRIDARVERMFEAGWVEECRRLLADERGISREATQALGYRQIWAWLREGEASPRPELIASIQTATRRFARKQLTWIRGLPDPHDIQVASGGDPLSHLETVRRALG